MPTVIAPDPVRLWADACRTMIALCQVGPLVFETALNDPTRENVDAAIDAFSEHMFAARDGDSAGARLMREMEAKDAIH